MFEGAMVMAYRSRDHRRRRFADQIAEHQAEAWAPGPDHAAVDDRLSAMEGDDRADRHVLGRIDQRAAAREITQEHPHVTFFGAQRRTDQHDRTLEDAPLLCP